MTSTRKPVIQGVKWNAFGRVLASGIQLVGSCVLARLLDAQSFGIFSLGITVSSLLQEIADGGFGGAVIRDKKLPPETLASLFWINVCLGIVILVSLSSVAPLIAAFFDTKQLTSVLRWLGLSFILSVPGSFLTWLLRRDLEFRRLAIVESTSAAVWFGVSIALAFMNWGVWSLVVGFIARSTTISLALFWARPEHRIFLARGFDLSAVFREAGLRRFAFFQVLERIVFLAANNVDFMLIGKFLGPTALGYYALSYNLVISLVRFINPLFTSVSFPALSLVKANPEKLRAGQLKLIQVLTATLLPALVGASVLAKPLIVCLYGSQWEISASLFQILTVYGLFYSLRAVKLSLFQVRGRTDLGFYFSLISLAAFGVANWVGIKLSGVHGVALSMALTSVFLLVPLELHLRVLGVGLSLRQVGNLIKTPVLATVFMASLVWILDRACVGYASDVVRLGLGMTAGASSYLLAYWLLDPPFCRTISSALLTRNA